MSRPLAGLLILFIAFADLGSRSLAASEGAARKGRETHGAADHPPPDGARKTRLGYVSLFSGLGIGAGGLVVGVLGALGNSEPLIIAGLALGVSGVIGGVALGAVLFQQGDDQQKAYQTWKAAKDGDADDDGADAEGSGNAASAAEGRTRLMPGSSEANRKDMRVGLLLAGLQTGDSVYQRALIMSWYRSRNVLFELDAQPAPIAASTQKLDVATLRTDQRQYALRYTRFVGNSLYLSGGLGVRALRWTASPLDKSVDGRVLAERSRRDAVAELSIGNRWQWRLFAVQLEWFGMQVPVGGGRETSRYRDEAARQAYEVRGDDRVATWRSLSYSGLILGLGFAA